MRITIIGASTFGTATAKTLVDHGHGVIVIDKNRAKLDALSETLDCGMIEGDGTRPAILREAWQGKSDVLIALTNASDDNILAALVGRSVGYRRVIPQIVEPDLLEVCAELDLSDTILPHDTVARSLVRAIEQDADVSENLILAGDLRLTRVDVPDGAPETLGALSLPEGARAIAVIDGEDEVLANPDTPLRPGHQILFVADTDCARTLGDDLF